LTPTLAEYLCDLVEHGINEAAVPSTIEVNFDRFRNVIIADSTILRLHRFLADTYNALGKQVVGRVELAL
jgi:putative transposase